MDNRLGIIAATALTWGMMADFQLDAEIRPKVRESCLGKAERSRRTAQKKRAKKQRRKG